MYVQGLHVLKYKFGVFYNTSGPQCILYTTLPHWTSMPSYQAAISLEADYN